MRTKESSAEAGDERVVNDYEGENGVEDLGR